MLLHSGVSYHTAIQYAKSGPKRLQTRRHLSEQNKFFFFYPSPAAIDRTRLLIGHSTLPYLEWSLQDFFLFSWPTC